MAYPYERNLSADELFKLQGKAADSRAEHHLPALGPGFNTIDEVLTSEDPQGQLIGMVGMVFSLHLSNDDAAYWWRRIHGVHRQHSGGENWEPEFERVWDQFWTAVRDKLPKELRSAPLFGKALPWQGAQGHHYRHRYPDEPFGYATKASSLTPRYVIAKFERILYQYLDNIDQFDLCEFLMNLGKDWPHRIRVSYVLWRFPKLRALLKTAAYSSDQDTPSRQVSEAFGIQNPQGLTYAQLIATAVGHTNRTTIEKARENDERTRVEALLAQKDQSQECRDMVISAMQQVWATCSPTNLNHPTACFVCFESMPVAIRQIGHWLMCGDCKNKFMTSHHTLSVKEAGRRYGVVPSASDRNNMTLICLDPGWGHAQDRFPRREFEVLCAKIHGMTLYEIGQVRINAPLKNPPKPTTKLDPKQSSKQSSKRKRSAGDDSVADDDQEHVPAKKRGKAKIYEIPGVAQKARTETMSDKGAAVARWQDAKMRLFKWMHIEFVRIAITRLEATCIDVKIPNRKERAVRCPIVDICIELVKLVLRRDFTNPLFVAFIERWLWELFGAMPWELPTCMPHNYKIDVARCDRAIGKWWMELTADKWFLTKLEAVCSEKTVTIVLPPGVVAEDYAPVSDWAGWLTRLHKFFPYNGETLDGNVLLSTSESAIVLHGGDVKAGWDPRPVRRSVGGLRPMSGVKRPILTGEVFIENYTEVDIRDFR